MKCDQYSTFLDNLELCATADEAISYTEWAATLSWKDASTILISFSLSDEYGKLTVSTLENSVIVEENISKRLNITSPSVSFSLTYLSPKSIAMVLGSSSTANSVTPIKLFISNLGSSYNNTAYDDGTTKVMLPRKTITDSIIPKQTTNPLPETFLSAGNAISTVSKVTVVGAAGVMLIASTCSVNVGPAFIKLFQIIEILGKLYFTPILFSAVMNFFLEKMFGLSDLFDFDKNMILADQKHQPNEYNYKLTTLKQDRYLLRSVPIFVLAYPPLVLLTWAIKGLFGRTKEGRAVHKVMNVITRYIFESSYVDFVFYGCYALGGYWDGDVYDGKYILNKILSIYILHQCAIYMIRIIYTGFKLQGRKNPKHSPYQEELEIVQDGMTAPALLNLSVRLLNPVFILRMFAYQLILVSTQNNPPLCLLLFLLIQSLSFLHITYITIKYKSFEGKLVFFQKISFEVCITCFIIFVNLRYIGIHSDYTDYLIILLTFLCILTQLIYAFKSIILLVVGAVRKVVGCIKKRIQGGNGKGKNRKSVIDPANPQENGRIEKVRTNRVSMMVGSKEKKDLKDNSNKILYSSQKQVERTESRQNKIYLYENKASKISLHAIGDSNNKVDSEEKKIPPIMNMNKKPKVNFNPIVKRFSISSKQVGNKNLNGLGNLETGKNIAFSSAVMGGRQRMSMRINKPLLIPQIQHIDTLKDLSGTGKNKNSLNQFEGEEENSRLDSDYFNKIRVNSNTSNNNGSKDSIPESGRMD